jgi:hypothetical protein
MHLKKENKKKKPQECKFCWVKNLIILIIGSYIMDLVNVRTFRNLLCNHYFLLNRFLVNNVKYGDTILNLVLRVSIKHKTHAHTLNSVDKNTAVVCCSLVCWHPISMASDEYETPHIPARVFTIIVFCDEWIFGPH